MAEMGYVRMLGCPAHSWHNYLPDLSRSYHSCLKLLPLVNCSILLPLMTLHKLQSLCAIWRHQTFIRCICVHVPRSYHSCLKLLPLVNCSILLPLMTLHKLQSLCAIWRHQTFIRCICVHVPTNLPTGREPMVNQVQLETSPLGLNWAGNCPTLMSYAVHVN